MVRFLHSEKSGEVLEVLGFLYSEVSYYPSEVIVKGLPLGCSCTPRCYGEVIVL